MLVAKKTCSQTGPTPTYTLQSSKHFPTHATVYSTHLLQTNSFLSSRNTQEKKGNHRNGYPPSKPNNRGAGHRIGGWQDQPTDWQVFLWPVQGNPPIATELARQCTAKQVSAILPAEFHGHFDEVSLIVRLDPWDKPWDSPRLDPWD